MPVSRYTLTIKDESLESSTVAARGVEITASNFDAQATLHTDFRNAVVAVIDGGLSKGNLVATQIGYTGTPGGARELKWLVSMVDAEGYPVTMEIPTADQSLCVSGSDLLDISAGVGLTLKNAIMALHKGRGPTAVNVLQVRLVGRSL